LSESDWESVAVNKPIWQNANIYFQYGFTNIRTPRDVDRGGLDDVCRKILGLSENFGDIALLFDPENI
jgi:hypothetical protein